MIKKSGNQKLDERMEVFVAACRNAGVRVTHQRSEIFREMAVSMDHPNTEAVFERVRNRIPSISRDTVYRTLAFLDTAGLIRKVDALAGPVRFDANPNPHHHFVCKVCRTIKDFESEEIDAFTPPRSLTRLGVVESIQVQLRGVCSACKRARAGKTNRSKEE